MAIQRATSKEDKINLGFRIFFFFNKQGKNPQKAKYLK